MIKSLNHFFLKRLSSFNEAIYIKLMPRKHYIKNLEPLIANLSGKELTYLNKYISLKQTTIYVDLCDEVMAKLYTKEFTEINKENYRTSDGYGFDLNQWAREYLTENNFIFKDSPIDVSSLSKRKY